MKGMKLQTLLCVGCLLPVEKAGRSWVQRNIEVEEAAEIEDVKVGEVARLLREGVGAFEDENIGNGSMGLARE
jgi:hypothetical protein